MDPIRLTNLGDFLQPNDSLKEDDELKMENGFYEHMGVHMHCGGDMFLRRGSERYNALFCQECYLRIILPKEATTCRKINRECAFCGSE